VDVWGAVLVAVGVLLSVGTHSNVLKRLFNSAQFVIAAAAAGAIFDALGGSASGSNFHSAARFSHSWQQA
jgi:hypothetical protein